MDSPSGPSGDQEPTAAAAAVASASAPAARRAARRGGRAEVDMRMFPCFPVTREILPRNPCVRQPILPAVLPPLRVWGAGSRAGRSHRLLSTGPVRRAILREG